MGPLAAKFLPFDLERLATGSLFVSRPVLRHYTATTEELTWRASQVFDSVLSGKLQVELGHVYPLAEAARAQQDLASRLSVGKLLLQVQDE